MEVIEERARKGNVYNCDLYQDVQFYVKANVQFCCLEKR